MMGDRSTGGLDLAVGYPGSFQSLQTKCAKR
jgi:hypothetical protein